MLLNFWLQHFFIQVDFLKSRFGAFAVTYSTNESKDRTLLDKPSLKFYLIVYIYDN